MVKWQESILLELLMMMIMIISFKYTVNPEVFCQSKDLNLKFVRPRIL